MGKDETKDVKNGTDESTEHVEKTVGIDSEEVLQGVTVGMGAYKPIPKFRGNCPNC